MAGSLLRGEGGPGQYYRTTARIEQNAHNEQLGTHNEPGTLAMSNRMLKTNLVPVTKAQTLRLVLKLPYLQL